MRLLKNALLLLVAAAVSFTSCIGEEDREDNNIETSDKFESEISINSISMTIDSEGGAMDFSFYTNEYWTTKIINSRADEWLKVLPNSGNPGNSTITITAKSNENPEERNATIVIEAGSKSSTVKITQKQKDALTVSGSRFEMPQEGGEILVEVAANIDFEYQIDEQAKDWISYSGTRALTTSGLRFRIAENNTTKKREGRIYITSGQIREEIIVYQDGEEPTIIISKNEYLVGSEGETISVEVKSNVDVTVDMPHGVDWIKENVTRSVSTCTYRFDILPNSTYDQRVAEIRFTDKQNGLSETVKITQKQKDALTVTGSRFEMPQEGGEILVEVAANIDFEYQIDEQAKDWISYSGTRALTTSGLKFNIAENNTTKKREGRIYITCGQLREEIIVYQDGEEPTIIISKNEYLVGSEGETISVEVKSNVDVTVDMPHGVDWIKENVTRSVSTCTYRFDILPNETEKKRSAEIVFINKEYGCYCIASITQEFKGTLVLSKNEYTFGRNGGDLYLKLQTNSDINVEVSENAKDWILSSYTRSTVIQGLYFMILEYEGTSTREGTITISAGNTEEKIRVVQDPLSSGSELRYKSTDGNIVIPNDPTRFGADIISNIYNGGEGVITFEGNINAIGENAFEGCTTLASLEIPEGITSIGDSAFAGCNCLEYISLPNTILSIGNYAFKDCTGKIVINCNIPDAEDDNDRYIGCFEESDFSEVIITDWVNEIGLYAFRGCENIKYISIPKSINRIGRAAFQECSGEAHIYCDIPSTDSYWGVFQGAGFTSVVLEDSCTKIGDMAFKECSNLEKVKIPDSIRYIGEHAFESCYMLNCDLVIPKGVTIIESGTFEGCSKVRSIDIPSSVSSIKAYAFSECGGDLIVRCNLDWDEDRGLFYNAAFKTATIVEGVTEIDYASFRECRYLTSVTLPKTLTKIGSSAFYLCSSLKSIDIPKGVEEIGYRTFEGCINLVDVKIPEGMKYIGEEAFCECSSVKSITIPSSVTRIDEDAFAACTGELTINCNTQDYYITGYDSSPFESSWFTTVTFGDNVTKIGQYLFEDNDYIKSVTIGAKVNSIGKDAFNDCSNLHSVYSKAPTPPALIDKQVFNYNASDRKFYVPKASVFAYKSSQDWSTYFDKIEGYLFSIGDESGSMENPEDDGSETDW